MIVSVCKGVMVVQWDADPLGVNNEFLYRTRMRILAEDMRCHKNEKIEQKWTKTDPLARATVEAAKAVYGCAYE